MKSLILVFVLLSGMTASADFSFPLAVTSLMCTGVGVQNPQSVISLHLSPQENSAKYQASYRIDQNPTVELTVEPMKLESEGSILIRTYGKYAAGPEDYLNLLMGGDATADIVRDRKSSEGYAPAYMLTGYMTFNRERKFQVSCVVHLIKVSAPASPMLPPHAKPAL